MTNSEHTSKRFDLELSAIRDSILRMGGLVREQFNLVIEVLNNGNTASISRVLDIGYQVNSLEIEVDRKCNLVLAQRQPEAIDLRTILTALKITTDLKRIGEQSEAIARKTEMLFHESTLNIPRSTDVIRCAMLALGMVDESLQAYAQADASIAIQVIRKDEKVNDEYNLITRNLISHMMEDPRFITSALGFLSIVKAVERIADHAKKVSEFSIFMVKGLDVRHTSIEDVEKKAL